MEQGPHIDPDKDIIQFNFLKSNLFRVTHVDGAVGNLTPSKGIFVALYNERASIPDAVQHEVDAKGFLQPAFREDRTSPGMIRELEIGFFVDIQRAKVLGTWLLNMAAKAEEQFGSGVLQDPQDRISGPQAEGEKADD